MKIVQLRMGGGNKKGAENFSTRALATLGDKNAGKVGPNQGYGGFK